MKAGLISARFAGVIVWSRKVNPSCSGRHLDLSELNSGERYDQDP